MNFRKLAYSSLLVFWWGLAIVNGSKGLWLSYFLALLLLVVACNKSAIRFFLVQIFGILGGVAVAFLLISGLPFLSGHYSSIHYDNFNNVNGSFGDRLLLWKKAIDLIRTHYLLGVGPMHYAYFPNNLGAHPHNAFLLVACEWGLLAAFALSFLVGWGLYRWFKLVSVSIDPHFLALSTSLVAGLLYSLCGGVIVTPLSQIMMCLTAGCALGLYQSRLSRIVPRETYGLPLVIWLSLVMSSALIVTALYQQLPDLSQNEIQYYFQHGQPILRPRFWVQGWLR